MEGGEESRIEDSDVLREVGRTLRNQRLALRQSLSEVANDLRIKESYLSHQGKLHQQLLLLAY